MLTRCILLMTSFLQDFNWLAGSIDFVACVRVRVSNTSDCLYLGYGVWGVEGPLHYPLQLACILFPPMFSSRFLGLNSFACFVNYVDLLRVPLFYLHRGFSLSFCLVPISIWRFPHILRFLNIAAIIYNIDICRFWIIRLSYIFNHQVQAGKRGVLIYWPTNSIFWHALFVEMWFPLSFWYLYWVMLLLLRPDCPDS